MQNVCGVCIISGTIHFCAITGGQNGCFGQARLIRSEQMLAKIVQRFLKKFGVKGDLFPNGDRRCVMIDAECQQLHNGDYRFDGPNHGGKKGVKMGFLAFLLIGGASGAASWIVYPGAPKKRPNPIIRASSFRGPLFAALLGFMTAALSSYAGQYLNYFQSGQILEWVSAILAACAVGCIYTALVK
jgi:hypothetical protein